MSAAGLTRRGAARARQAFHSRGRMRFTSSAVLGTTLLGTTLLLGACGGDDDGVSATPYEVVLSVTPATIAVGQDSAANITAQVIEQNRNTVLPNASFTFTSSDTTIATVSSTGRVRGIRGGSATITVSYFDPFEDQTLTQSVQVTVRPHPAATVSLTPDTRTMYPGDQFTFTAVALTAAGDTVYCNCFSPTRVMRDVRFFFTAPDTTRITVSSGGRVTAKDSAGTFQLVFRVGADDKADTSTITLERRPATSVVVTPDPAAVKVGGTVQLTATLTAANGQTLTGRNIIWSTSNAAIATVDQTGLVTGVAPGLVTIAATSTLEPITGAAQVSVIP